MAADEIERFKREALERGGDLASQLIAGKEIDDATLLREVMNTVGKPGTLGESIRCVVSVSMLTEGWDANTVTHVLGVRAFGTQLLCEQVIGRALRRQSYDLNEEDLFNVEYADVLGIPFDFTAKPVDRPAATPARPSRSRPSCPNAKHWKSGSPGWPATGWSCRKSASQPASTMIRCLNSPRPLSARPSPGTSGIIGEAVDLSLEHIRDMRRSTLLFHLPSGCSTPNGATPERNPSCTCSASSSASPNNGWTPAWSARATPIPAC
jgi:type III restriction enzyme